MEQEQSVHSCNQPTRHPDASWLGLQPARARNELLCACSWLQLPPLPKGPLRQKKPVARAGERICFHHLSPSGVALFLAVAY